MQSRDPTTVRSLLHRSLSMNVSNRYVTFSCCTLHVLALKTCIFQPRFYHHPQLSITWTMPCLTPRGHRCTHHRPAPWPDSSSCSLKCDTPPPVPETRSRNDLSTSDHSDPQSPCRLQLFDTTVLMKRAALCTQSHTVPKLSSLMHMCRTKTRLNHFLHHQSCNRSHNVLYRCHSRCHHWRSLSPLLPVPSVQSAIHPLPEHPVPLRPSSHVTPAPLVIPSRSPLWSNQT